MTAVGALLGLSLGVGVLLVASGWRGAEPPLPGRHGIPDAVKSRLMRAAGAVLVAVLLTRWPVAVLAGGLLGWFSPDLLGGRRARDLAMTRTEAIATWTEMLRDTIASAHGLEAAINATSPISPEPIRAAIVSLSVALEREPLSIALADLADDLAHPIADLVVAALTVAADGSVRELSDLLGTLADSARDEAAMQMRVEAARARVRTAVRVITGCTVAAALGLIVLSPDYVLVYGSAVGQLTLVFIAACWGVALWWLAQMSEFRVPERFLVGTSSASTGGAS